MAVSLSTGKRYSFVPLALPAGFTSFSTPTDMKKLSSLGMALSMSFAILPSAFAAEVIIRNEPTNGFTKGADPEWSSTHETLPSDAPNHRQYHRDAEDARTEWLNVSRSTKGTSAYNRLHRMMVQLRNMLHRQYHMNLDILAAARRPTITVMTPNGGEMYRKDGSAMTINWRTGNVPASHLIDSITLKAYPNGQEYVLATNIQNDGQEIIVPSSVPLGSYRVELKTYFDSILVLDTSDSFFTIGSASTSGTSSSSSSSSSSTGLDTIPPSVFDTTPDSNMTNVSTESNLTILFNENMHGSTISDSSFTLSAATGRVSGTVTMAGATATFNPSASLAPNTLYTATITTGVRDLAANPLARSFSWTFTTGSVSASTNQPSVALGAASTFAVLAGSTVTNTGPTTVTGDLGVSAGSAVTGFAPGVVNSGAMHAGDTLAAQAQLALTTAYNDLAGRSVNPVSVAGNLGGTTLAPGLYKSTSGLQISSGDLTLDAKGDANAIFIFQIASTLNVSSGRQVTLTGGAKASNVYWQVGTSANLEANSVFKGSILADQSISLQTGARVDGRLLARIGAVTLQSNTITMPSN